MSKSRSTMAIIAGCLSLICAGFLVFFAVVMFLLETPPLTCILMGCTAAFPVIVAVACLFPRKRTPALRFIGATLCAACLGTLVMSFVAPPGEGKPRQRRGALIGLAIAGAVMALKGKWPGSDTEDKTSEEPPTAGLSERPQ